MNQKSTQREEEKFPNSKQQNSGRVTQNKESREDINGEGHENEWINPFVLM